MSLVWNSNFLPRQRGNTVYRKASTLLVEVLVNKHTNKRVGSRQTLQKQKQKQRQEQTKGGKEEWWDVCMKAAGDKLSPLTAAVCL